MAAPAPTSALPAPATPPPEKRRAYVTFLMFNDSYLPGCLMAAYGLKRQRSRAKRVCVVTRDISARARSALSVLYDEVIQVGQIAVPADPDARGTTLTRTGSARVQSAALTRFAVLRLGPDGDLGCRFEKVVMIDADVLPIRDFDALWGLPAPAGIINEDRSHMAEVNERGGLVVRPESLETGRWIWHDVYDEICPHGSPIPREITDRVAVDRSNFGVNGSLLVIEPSMPAFDDFMRWVSTREISRLVRDEWPWIDQQAATLYWSGHWTSVDISFSTLYGYPSLDIARGLHFAGIKPWSWRKKGFARRLQRFPDYRLWADVYVEMLEALPELRDYSSLRRIEQEVRAALPG